MLSLDTRLHLALAQLKLWEENNHVPPRSDFQIKRDCHRLLQLDDKVLLKYASDFEQAFEMIGLTLAGGSK